MEREGRGEGRRRGGGEKMRGIIVGGMVLGLLMGCNNGIAELEKKNTFFDSIIKIGHEFQEIFGNFGNVIGDALGFNAVKSSDKRSAVGVHFENVKQGLEGTKKKLGELSGKISEAKNADTKGVEAVISSASGVFEKLISELDKLAKVTKEDSSTDLGDTANNTAAIVANKDDVNAVIAGVREIIEVAKNSDVKIEDGKDGGSPVATASGGNVVAKNGSGVTANDSSKLADEVAQAGPWAMINKIKDAKTAANPASLSAANNDAGELSYYWS